jgi:hypothetical protein
VYPKTNWLRITPRSALWIATVPDVMRIENEFVLSSSALPPGSVGITCPRSNRTPTTASLATRRLTFFISIHVRGAESGVVRTIGGIAAAATATPSRSGPRSRRAASPAAMSALRPNTITAARMR